PSTDRTTEPSFASSVTLSTTVWGQTIAHFLGQPAQPSPTYISRDVKFYADPGSALVFGGLISMPLAQFPPFPPVPPGTAVIDATISGRLVSTACSIGNR